MTNITNITDNEDELKNTEPPFAFYHQTIIQNIYHYYISSYIYEAHYYVDMINRIQTAEANDTIYIHLNTIGGDMDAGIQIINAMKVSAAHIVSSLEGGVSSMGGMIFLSAKEFLVHENSFLMIHNYTGGVYGKGHEQVAALQSATKWTEDFMYRLYVPFLSEDEVRNVIKGEDIYIHPPEIIDRLNKMVAVDEIVAETPKPKRSPRKKTSSRK